MIVTQKNNSVIEVEYTDKSENAPPTDGTEHQRRKSDLELRPTATLQALVDDSNCDFKKLKLNPNDTADEIMYQTLRASTLK